MILGVFILITAFFVFYCLSTFFEKQFRKRKIINPDAVQEDLLARKEENLAALNDLEYDYKMKKIGEKDYAQLKEKMTQETIEVMKKLDSLEEKKNEAVSVAGKSTGTRKKIRS